MSGAGAPRGGTQVEQFAPEMILRDLSDPTFPAQPPRLTQKPACAMFADISGYTKLSEEFAQLGPLGAENLAFWLNRCAPVVAARARARRVGRLSALGVPDLLGVVGCPCFFPMSVGTLTRAHAPPTRARAFASRARAPAQVL